MPVSTWTPKEGASQRLDDLALKRATAMKPSAVLKIATKSVPDAVRKVPPSIWAPAQGATINLGS